MSKINSYGEKVNTDFQGKRIPKENASCKLFSRIILDSFIRVKKVLSSNPLVNMKLKKKRKMLLMMI